MNSGLKLFLCLYCIESDGFRTWDPSESERQLDPWVGSFGAPRRSIKCLVVWPISDWSSGSREGLWCMTFTDLGILSCRDCIVWNWARSSGWFPNGFWAWISDPKALQCGFWNWVWEEIGSEIKKPWRLLEVGLDWEETMVTPEGDFWVIFTAKSSYQGISTNTNMSTSSKILVKGAKSEKQKWKWGTLKKSSNFAHFCRVSKIGFFLLKGRGMVGLNLFGWKGHGNGWLSH